MSVVYKATAQGPGGFEKVFAVKVLNRDKAKENETVTMFMDEARLGARLMHPNIVPVLDFGRTGDGYFIAMEYVEGASLAELMRRRFKRGTGFTRDEVLYVATEVLKALDYAHNFRDSDGKKRPVIHRDVSPENVLISGTGTVKLCDFGIAKGDFRSEETRTGIVKGKIAYIAPEVVKKGRAVSPRSDIYSLGVVLFEMLKGQRVGAERLQIESVEDLECDEPLKDLVRQALAPEPDQRFGSASAMLNAVNAMDFDPILAARGLGKGLVRRKRKKIAAKTKTAVDDTLTRAREKTVQKAGSDQGFTLKLLILFVILLFATALILAVFKINLLR